MANPYTLLGVASTASQDDIKKAYRKLARKMHPDLNPNDPKAEDRFKEITGAYDILSDPNKRKRFDAGEIDETGKERPGFGFTGGRGGYGPQGGAQGFGGNTHGFGGRGFDGFDFNFGNTGTKSNKRRSGFDFFSDMFGSGEDIFSATHKQTKTRGNDANYDLNVTFLDAALGRTKEIRLPSEKVLKVQIPAGTTDKMVLRLKGQGGDGKNGAENGDALIRILVATHPFFERRDNDILLTVPVTLKEALLGGKITIPTLEGNVSLTVPPRTNNGAVLRLRGKGIKTAAGTGDELVKLSVELPDPPDAGLEALIKKWTPESTKDPRVKAGII